VAIAISGCHGYAKDLETICDAPKRSHATGKNDVERATNIAKWIAAQPLGDKAKKLFSDLGTLPPADRIEHLRDEAAYNGVVDCDYADFLSNMRPVPPTPIASTSSSASPSSSLDDDFAAPAPTSTVNISWGIGATASGDTPVDPILRIVRGHPDDFRACYLAGLARDPKLRGRVVVHFDIDATGKVVRAGLNKGGLPDQAVADCVLEAMKKLTFPPPDKPPVSVVYPFDFAPE
jgi:TonB family protein